jgi:hypothetical protein
MNATANILESGLRPEPAPTLERAVSESTSSICHAIASSIAASLMRIREAEKNAITRLNEFVPTEPLMDSKQAAAYLRIPLRSLHLMTCPKNLELPFVWIGGVKRFRKASLDAHLDNAEIKRVKVKL